MTVQIHEVECHQHQCRRIALADQLFEAFEMRATIWVWVKVHQFAIKQQRFCSQLDGRLANDFNFAVQSTWLRLMNRASLPSTRHSMR